ncbi:exodeoxyribonuclease III [Candidatus Shapirobacteria bacterium CG_4_8_14_3_um_filter_39_11]|uniref:Exodeoxyribonuclease III n=1 Tax=Candidatus Shapirobacteria bacterium CG_4_8_14_3_um_filter_39_11 TaxID=1974875 RepID=A0A2M8GH67_9BACT|nr:MAG: exodeoxyribonuclease III [Candidatus Shapirobacteria bacterium CG_4_8_14_3_um_filter_39_11]
MKIVSWNVNGLRAVFNKGFSKWLKEIDAGIVCLQEIKLQEFQLSKQLISPGNYLSYFNFAEKKGYSGVGVYTKEKPLTIENQLGLGRFDQEGRILKLEYPDFTLINLYIPHGGRKKENLQYKLDVYKTLLDQLKNLNSKKIIMIGDFNVAHEEIDLARPKDNHKNIMFTTEERKQLDEIVDLGFIDTFRKFNKKGGNYTWWPYFVNARERNLGWRIDYIFVSKPLWNKLKDAFILKDVYGSDHCPVGIEKR